ncbi:MAG: FAD-dependent monooxygenase [Candidatus Helarchaeota archaeon]
MKEYDLIIVGAGPGGSTAAKYAADLGLKTILFEMGRRPGEKNCSGTALSTKVFRDFPYIKKDFETGRISRFAITHFINKELIEESFFGFSASSRLGRYKEAKEFLTLNLYRSEFDPYLCDLAVNSGAELRTSTLITDLLKDENGNIIGAIDEHGEKYKGIVIGADGVTSTVARKSGLRTRWQPDELTLMLTVEYEADENLIDKYFEDQALHYWFSPEFPVGYSFFHKAGIHVGLGLFVNEFKKHSISYLNKFLQVRNVKKQIEIVNGKGREFQAHLLTFVKRPRKTWKNGVMLIGDAAGFPCPAEAEGIYYAMLSGKLAAEVASIAISNNDFNDFKSYEYAWLNSPIGEEFEAGPEIYEFIRAGPFSMKASEWIVPFLNDLLFSILNVSDSHIYNLRFLIPRLLKYPKFISFFIHYITPAIFPITEHFIKEKINQILPNYLPKILLDKAINSINSIKSIRERLFKLVNSFFKEFI